MNNEQLLQNFKELNTQIEAAYAEMRAKSEGLIASLVKEFLENCPEVTGVHWTQYTPYFNDGESCEFGVNEICFHILDDEDDEVEPYESSSFYTSADLDKAVEKLKTAEEYTANPDQWRENYLLEYKQKWNRDYSYGADRLKPYPSDSVTAQEHINEIKENLEKYDGRAEFITEEFKKLKDAISSIPEKVMESVFGDHAFVIIDRNGVRIDEYNHD